MWFTQLWLKFTVFCYKTPSSLAEIYNYFGRNLLRLSSTLKMLTIFYQNTRSHIFKQVNKQSKRTS
jgi:hypothetical protein